MKVKSLFVWAMALACMLMVTTMASANTIWSGSLSTANAGEIYATDGWSTTGKGLTLSWNNTLVGNHVHYTYTITNATGGDLTKAISHVIVGVSDSFGLSDLLAGALPVIPQLRSDTTPPQTRWSSADPSNPGLPSPMSGLKFDGGGAKHITISFDSDRVPTWGNVYIRDGVDGTGRNKIDVLAYDGNANGFNNSVGVPDSVVVVPVPAAVWGGLSLLGGLAIKSIKRRLTAR